MGYTATLTNMGVRMSYAVMGAASLAIVVPIALKIFDWMTKDIDEMEELKKGNMAVAFILGCVILGMSLIDALAMY